MKTRQTRPNDPEVAACAAALSPGRGLSFDHTSLARVAPVTIPSPAAQHCNQDQVQRRAMRSSGRASCGGREDTDIVSTTTTRPTNGVRYRGAESFCVVTGCRYLTGLPPQQMLYRSLSHTPNNRVVWRSSCRTPQARCRWPPPSAADAKRNKQFRAPCWNSNGCLDRTKQNRTHEH
jgi:hypothetical protein